MKTYTKSDFFFFFMNISEKLTLAELRLLYLLITEPTLIELSQQEIADKLKTNRRTVNIGLKKLKEHKYIRDVKFKDREKRMVNYQEYNKDNQEISQEEIKRAKDIVNEFFINKYRPYKKENIVVNEDFFSSIMGDFRLHPSIRYSKKFIANILKKAYPGYKLFDKKSIQTEGSDIRQRIILRMNSEIVKARKFNRYYIDKVKLIQDLTSDVNLSESELFNVIREEFPLIVISKDRLRIKKPESGDIKTFH